METQPAASQTPGLDLLASVALRHNLPQGMHLQIADRCNHTCVHCYQIQGLKSELSLEQLRAVLDDLAAAQVLFLNISGGESTLRPDLIEIMAYARSRGFAIRLYTNAFAMTEALADEIARVGVLEVHVSVYSDRDDEHDAVTCVPGSLERTLRGIKMLRARNVRVCMKSPALSLAPNAAERLEALAESLGCKFVASWDITPREDGALDTLATAVEGDALVAQGLLPPWQPTADDGARRAAKLAAASCGVCTSAAVVHPNGDLVACTDTPVTLGNLTRQGLRDIYASNPDVALFRDLTWGDVHGCRSCDLLLACHRCHATALRQQGDYLGPYEQACNRARARYAAGAGRPLEMLEPAAECDPGRNPAVGPYRIEGVGALRPVADVPTPDDDARAARHTWLRKRGLEAADDPRHGGLSGLVPVTRLTARALDRG